MPAAVAGPTDERHRPRHRTVTPRHDTRRFPWQGLHPWIGLGLPTVLALTAMWQVRRYTVDDAYISFRYARNLVDGHGLVFNPGEAVEGYTNFLWTLAVAGGLQLGLDPVLFAKGLGAISAVGTLACVYWIAHRLQPFRMVPCLATWLLASSMAFSGYAVFGLETAGFVALVTLGVARFLRERDDDTAFPWSGLVFAAAALTRPEAPLFIGLAVLSLGWRALARQNVLRLAMFAAPVLLHLAWRHQFYGEWLPNTVYAKTGDAPRQLTESLRYIFDYMAHVGPMFLVPLLGISLAVRQRHRDVLLLAAISLAWFGYLLVVGRDWMPYFRFMAPLEPFWFLVGDYALRRITRPRRWVVVTLAVFLAGVSVHRAVAWQDARARVLEFHEPYWREIYGTLADWFLEREPGLIGLGDLGYVGYATGRPILDLIGLTDREIARTEGGYTTRFGRDYRDYVFSRIPAYFVFSPHSRRWCRGQHFRLHRELARDPRFGQYRLVAAPGSERFGSLCVFARADISARPAAGPDRSLSRSTDAPAPSPR